MTFEVDHVTLRAAIFQQKKGEHAVFRARPAGAEIHLSPIRSDSLIGRACDCAAAAGIMVVSTPSATTKLPIAMASAMFLSITAEMVCHVANV